MVGRPNRILWLVLVPAMLSGCVGTPGQPPPPAVTASASAVPSEMTADEDLALNPPAPTNVRVAKQSGTTVELVWDPPPPVRQPHYYSDRVVGYRVYRGSSGELRPIGTSSVQRFSDTVGRGTYSYAVTSIREQNVEGTKSNPAVIVTVS